MNINEKNNKIEGLIVDKNVIMEALSATLPGLTMYVRDVNLDKRYTANYEKGMIIKEKGFTDASNRVMGLSTTHRYTILSNHMADLSRMEKGTNWGLHVANKDSHFKILDIYKYEGKTQILLLHLPDDDKWKVFKDITFDDETELIEDCRKRFEKKITKEPIKELTTQDWLLRCQFPLGMTDDAKLFDIE